MKPKNLRLPQPSEQQVLDRLLVRLIQPDEQPRFDAQLIERHYLHSADLVGECLRYVAEDQGQWLALLSWSAAAYHLKPRDSWIGWTNQQRRRRLSLLVNNSRFLILPDAHLPNLASRAMGLCLKRLSTDWQAQHGHPVLVAESFVDGQFFRGTSYKVSGWTQLGQTQGFGRHAEDYYVAHDRPKQLWVRELSADACAQLRAVVLPPALAPVEERVSRRCTQSVKQLRALKDRFAQLPDWRTRMESYPAAGLLAIIAGACFCGESLGQRELARFAAGLTQAQRRALGIRRDRKTGLYPAPRESTFFRALAGVDTAALQQVLLAWQDQLLGPRPPEDDLVIVDGKELRGSLGAQLLSAFAAKTGRWLGSELIEEKSNEIPAARPLLDRLDLDGQMVVLDALHTQEETARHIVQEKGADYLLTVKDNQKGLRQCLDQQLFASLGAFPPSAKPTT
jgi:hypothetical protein